MDFKVSRYNKFQTLEDGKTLVYNGFSGGLAIMDNETLAEYNSIKNGENTFIVRDITINELKKAHFVIPRELDELDEIKANHYYMRFSNKGLGFTIVPTLECNFRCTYCFEPQNNNNEDIDQIGIEPKINSFVEDSIVDYANKQLNENTSLMISWYGGEPLLAIDRIKSISKRLIEICDFKKSKYVAGMVSNGFLIDQEIVKILIESKIANIQITLDGQSEIHNQRRMLINGGETFETIIRNIVLLTNYQEIFVTIRVNIDHRNSNSAIDLLHTLKVMGLEKKKNFVVYPAIVVSNTKFCKDSEFCMRLNEFAEIEIQFYKTAFELGFNAGKSTRPNIANCGAVTPNSLVILPNGELHKCWNTCGDSTKSIGVLEKGSVTYKPDTAFKWLGWNPFRNDCEKCNVLPQCMGGCPYNSIYKSSNVGPQVICNSLKRNLSEMLKIRANSIMRNKNESSNSSK